MGLSFIEIVRLLSPTNKKDKKRLEFLNKYLAEDELRILQQLIKTKKAGFSYASLGVSTDILANSDYPVIHLSLNEKDKEIQKFVQKVNEKIKEVSKEEFFRTFSVKADKIIPILIAPNLIGMDGIKEASALQLFTTEKFHILLLGDPGTGKTDVLRSASDMSPISSFGLGSGTSGAGLSLSVKGNEVIKGLLPLADGGLCCIDELNLMIQKDMASLYSAMEKGVVTYDKAKKHITVDARVNVLATANPKGDKFVGWMLNTLKQQLPFDSALLTRFHLVFLVRKPDAAEFERIARRIVEKKESKQNPNDIAFIKEYISYLKNYGVKLPKELEADVIEFSKKLKESEKDYLVEISPRIVHGILNLAKASARMNMRPQVMISDIAKVKHIFEESLKIRRK